MNNLPAESKLKKPLHYREYLQAQLTSPLKKDSLYSIQFYFCIASYSTYVVNRLGLYVSEEPVIKRLSTKVIEVEPQISLDTSKIYNDRDNWYQVCDTFRSKGEEQFITIGNFFDDYNTEIETLDVSVYRGTIQQTINENKLAYYYIDYVTVTPVPDTLSNYCINKFSINKKEAPSCFTTYKPQRNVTRKRTLIHIFFQALLIKNIKAAFSSYNIFINN